MYNTILVPLDGSKRAEAILDHVEDLAQHYQATVIFLQVVELHPIIIGYDSIYPVFEQQELDQQKQEAETYLATLQREFQEKNIEARTRIVQGPVVEAIIKTAEREEVDLIAMASHGRTGLPRVFYGSVAAGILHRVDRPLLLIRSLNGE
jgi:nucleotide-binding universal stress UspA family protein